MPRENDNHKRQIVGKRLIMLGLALLLASAGIFILTFFPVLREEYSYRQHENLPKVVLGDPSNPEVYGPGLQLKVLEPPNTEFSIVVPKIAAVAPVIANVDPYNSQIYQRKLTQGVAHAKGTSLPGQGGNVFIFAHSAGNFYDANRYNAVFYLLNKLKGNDEIDVFYKGEMLKYLVTHKNIVEPDDVQYLSKYSSGDETLTLMTCWPPGTTLKRLVVRGSLADQLPLEEN